MINIKPISKKALWDELDESIVNFILFCGDRMNIVDEVLAAYDGIIFVGAITMSPIDEMHKQKPTIHGLMVIKEWRRRGIGRRLMQAAIARMRARELVPVSIDVMSKNAAMLIEGLEPELKKDLICNDMSEFDCFEKMENEFKLVVRL